MQHICQIIDGKKYAHNIFEHLKGNILHLKDNHNVTVGLSVILVGDDPASTLYVSTKAKRALEIGIDSKVYRFDSKITQSELINHIAQLNNDNNVHGILVQLPMPAHINTQNIVNSLDYRKDVDGFSIQNVGLLNSWQESLEPCTPQGIMIILQDVFNNQLAGKKVVVLGRSRIVGRPMVGMLIREGCSVTSLNSHSINSKEICREADIIVSAVGSPRFIDASWVKFGACVIDVGIMKVGDKLCGDVDFDSVTNVAGFLTPVPGGIGPMTVACLMRNTVKAAYQQHNLILKS